MSTKEKRSAAYTISQVRRAGTTNEFYVTINRNGESLGDVKVLSSSSANAYYNDPDWSPLSVKPRKGALVRG